MIRCKKPPTLPWEYAFAAASSILRIASIWRYSGASSSVVVCTTPESSAGSIRLESGVVMVAVTTAQTIPTGACGRYPSTSRSSEVLRPEKQVEHRDPGLRIDRRGVVGRTTVAAELDLDEAVRKLVDVELTGDARHRREAERVGRVARVELDVEVGARAGHRARRHAADRPHRLDGADAVCRRAHAVACTHVIAALRVRRACVAAGAVSRAARRGDRGDREP